MDFTNRTALITGASRGIGKAIALKLAAHGARIVIAAKSVEENPKLGGTIYSAAAEIEALGGSALPVPCDIRFPEQIENAVAAAVAAYGGIDILVNNASAISLSAVEQTELKAFDLMFDINVRGTFFASRACIPYLKKGNNPHILNLSPPISLDTRWLSPHVAYTMSKYNMTMIALGLAGELKKYGIAVNSLWPKTTIATAAVRNLLGGEALVRMSRSPEIIADAAAFILARPATATGHCFLDEEVLAEEGITDLDHYAVTPGGKLYPDLFI